MKKLIIIIFAICLIAMASCTPMIYGDYGLVTSVEVNKGGVVTEKYKYEVGVNHQSSPRNFYKFYTNRLYQIGDTIEVVGKRYK